MRREIEIRPPDMPRQGVEVEVVFRTVFDERQSSSTVNGMSEAELHTLHRRIHQYFREGVPCESW